MLHAITFSIPEEKIIKTIPNKTKFLSNLIPGNLETYIYNTEEEYYKEYQTSFFAITCKKAGWDCMRHYEIIANGCIPYFIDIEKCPEKTMALLPKELLIEANKLYEKIIEKKEFQEEDKKEYQLLLTKLLNHTKKHLTTTKIAEYIIQKTKTNNAKKILFLSGDTSPDYLRCLILHGFKTTHGKNCHDYPIVPHIYKSNDPTAHLYGKGYTYSKITDPSLHDKERDKTIQEDIKNKYYDIIIYGSYHRGMPYYDIISEIYSPDKIILLCGEDIHYCNELPNWIKKGHHVFLREYK